MGVGEPRFVPVVRVGRDGESVSAGMVWRFLGAGYEGVSMLCCGNDGISRGVIDLRFWAWTGRGVGMSFGVVVVEVFSGKGVGRRESGKAMVQSLAISS